MLIKPPDDIARTDKHITFLSDFLKFFKMCTANMNPSSREDLCKNHSEMIELLVHFLADPLVLEPLTILTILGDVFSLDEALCSHLV